MSGIVSPVGAVQVGGLSETQLVKALPYPGMVFSVFRPKLVAQSLF